MPARLGCTAAAWALPAEHDEPTSASLRVVKGMASSRTQPRVMCCHPTSL